MKSFSCPPAPAPNITIELPEDAETISGTTEN